MRESRRVVRTVTGYAPLLRVGVVAPTRRGRNAAQKTWSPLSMIRLKGLPWQGSYAEAYVNAVSWAAGFVCTRPALDSGHKVDFIIAGAGADGTTRDPRLEVQVKSTRQLRLADGRSHYDFDSALYDWARKPQDLLYVPRLVVLVQVPADPEQ